MGRAPGRRRYINALSSGGLRRDSMTKAPTPLAARLFDRINSEGPISIADYMAACLSDPRHGYYTGRDPLGRSGDFTTAPEISQMFGELIGLWCVSVWEAMGSPNKFTLAELGPGRGTLMADALRAAAIRPGFAAAAKLALVEISPPLREIQAAALRGLTQPDWFENVPDLPAGPVMAIANEFFDALPVRQFARTGNGWAERVVGLKGDRLAFGLRPAVPPSLPSGLADAKAGAIWQHSAAAGGVAGDLAARIVAEGGAALIIDYGHAAPGLGDTLQAVRDHQYDEPLAHPGEADLTAHVDFAALAASASGAGAITRPVIDQATLLRRLGIAERAERLGRGKDAATIASIEAATKRLTVPDKMGRLFKALAYSSRGIHLPAFDS